MHWDTLATALQSTYKIMLLTTIYNTVLTAAGVTTTPAAALQLIHTHTQITQQHPEQAPPRTSPAHWLAQPIREHYTLIQWETEEANQWQENGQSDWSQSWNSQHCSLKIQNFTKNILLIEEFSNV